VAFGEPRVSTMAVPAGERFAWHVSPSAQPLGAPNATAPATDCG
jgi:hypothetical protein